MKRLSIILLSTSLLAGIAFARDAETIVATYKGGEVTESQIMQQFQPILEAQQDNKGKSFSELAPNLQETLVRAYINIKLLEQEAKNSGIESTKEFQKDYSFKMNNLKNQLLQQELLERYVKSHVTDKMIDTEYDKLVADLKGKQEIKVSHILVTNEKEALNIKNRLNKGEKFATLARKLSKDKQSKINGGELGYITPGQLIPEFEEKAFSMKVNEISAPVKTKFGWHIITVLDKRPAQVPEDAKSTIANNLSREAVEKYFLELGSKADIKVMLPKQETSKDTTTQDTNTK